MKLSIPAIHIPSMPSFRMPRFRRPPMLGTRKRKIADWASIALLIAYLLVCCALFFALVQPTFEGNSNVRVGADSASYYQIADTLRLSSSGAGLVALVTVAGSSLGPVLLALVLRNALWIALFDVCLFVCSIWVASRIQGVNPWIFAVFLAFNAETAASILTLNKEIFALFAMVLFVYYIYSRKRSVILLSVILLFSLFARWEQAAIVIIFLAFSRKNSYFASRPKLTIFIILIGLSLAYPLMLHSSQVDLSGYTTQAEGGHAIVVLNTLQSHYAYFLAVIPKILMDILGKLATPSYFLSQYWTEDFNDLQNQFIVHSQALATSVVCVAVLVRKRWKFKYPIPYLAALYLIITAINPFVQPRYEYPVFVLLCLELARTNEPTDCSPVRKESEA
ncbi:MAG TPA: hypothetical protein VK814_04685 [Acidobacteriaceae bacterium]|nr:hypothetical protein [Acidobacteriaceae bacterium]